MRNGEKGHDVRKAPELIDYEALKDGGKPLRTYLTGRREGGNRGGKESGGNGNELHGGCIIGVWSIEICLDGKSLLVHVVVRHPEDREISTSTSDS